VSTKIVSVYPSDQHTSNINKGLYLQPQIHAACTTDDKEQILL
jgi:hypothetical protein